MPKKSITKASVSKTSDRGRGGSLAPKTTVGKNRYGCGGKIKK